MLYLAIAQKTRNIIESPFFQKMEGFLGTPLGAVFFLSLPIFFALSPLFWNSIFFHEDTFFHGYPAFSFFQKSIEVGDSFLWNPNNFSGFPSFSSMAFGFFSPLNQLIFRLFSLFDAYILIIFINFIFSAYLTAYFLRLHGVGVWGAYIGGLVYVFSQWRIINDHSIVAVVPLVPLLFVALWKAYSGSWRWLFFGGLGGGAILLAGHYHYVIEGFIAVGISSFWIAWAHRDFGWRKIFYPVKCFCVISILAFLIGSIIFIPAYVSLESSARSGGTSFSSGGIMPMDAIQLLSPYIEFGSSFGRFLPGPGEQKYIGVLPLFLVIIGFSLRKGTRFVRFFSYFLLGSLGAAMAYSPIAAFLHFLPGLSFLNYNQRWMFVAYFGAAVIAGFGFDRFFSGEFAGRIRRTWRIFFLSGLFVWGGIFLGWVASFVFGKRLLAFGIRYFDIHYYRTSLFFPLEHYHQYIERIFNLGRQVFDILNPKVFFVFSFFLISMWIVRVFIRSSDREVFKPLFVVIIAANFIFVFFFSHVYLPRSEFFLPSKTVEFLRTRENGRILPFLPGQSEFFRLSTPYRKPVPPELSYAFGKELLQANTNLYFGVSSIDYFDQLMSRRMSRIIAALGASHPTVGTSLTSEDKRLEEKVKILSTRKNLLNFSGTRYIISAYPFDNMKFPKIFETVILPPYNIPIAIYENKEARPRFYFADSVETIHENEEAAFEKLKTIPEEGLSIFIECSSGEIPNPKSQIPNKSQISNSNCENLVTEVDGKGEIEVQTKKNTVSILKTKSETSQFLVFSENHLPGWKAYVDGQETPIYTVGSVYMGIAVPGGEHEVKFEFTYRTIIEEFFRRYSFF
ncbi:MAG: hypothetical protein A3D41_02070 [Candidatus Sungbacteria bacterium RIFCSPHIGHO2_02_FULL_41_12b]|nr:MAG: hypothetical protein A3D41_02070 [Candidatus Sungbacteria bacterium RIFCSPHIGHO2_02_FULL_41_12b]